MWKVVRHVSVASHVHAGRLYCASLFLARPSQNMLGGKSLQVVEAVARLAAPERLTSKVGDLGRSSHRRQVSLRGACWQHDAGVSRLPP